MRREFSDFSNFFFLITTFKNESVINLDFFFLTKLLNVFKEKAYQFFCVTQLAQIDNQLIDVQWLMSTLHKLRVNFCTCKSFTEFDFNLLIKLT